MSTKSAAENPKQLTRPKMDNEPMKQKEIAHGESALLARWPIMAQEKQQDPDRMDSTETEECIGPARP